MLTFDGIFSGFMLKKCHKTERSINDDANLENCAENGWAVFAAAFGARRGLLVY